MIAFEPLTKYFKPITLLIPVQLVSRLNLGVTRQYDVVGYQVPYGNADNTNTH
jgi:hypothetical protein